MAKRRGDSADMILQSLPPLPLAEDRWPAIFDALGISGQQCAVAKLMLRDASNSEIVAVLGIGEGTVKEHQKRMYRRTKTHSRVQLAMRVLAVSHELNGSNCLRSPG